MKTKTLNITPSMDLVRLIGEISNLKGHACIAELIDNSIDAFIGSEIDQDSNKIDVQIPSSHMLEKDTPLTVVDNGKGMNAEELESALTAGISSKTFDGTLGLFGIGFNVACATLGKKVSVRTSRSDMDHDLLAIIDLDQIRKFRRKDKTTQIDYMKVEKTFNNSGTIVEISHYLPKAKSLLNIKRVQNELNKSYSSIISEKYNISISVNEKPLIPYVFCIWNKNRYVDTQKHGKVYAYHEIEEKLIAEKYFSINDGMYVDDTDINDYDENDLVKRPITISGWLGIQRFLDQDNYGINVVRNGRVILRMEKDQFFKWKNRYDIDDDILEGYKYWDKNKEEMRSYPIDNEVMGGRIVGEIHANFIHPNPIKNKLANDEDEAWLAVLEEIKGISPLQPRISEELGFEKNISPLAMLYSAYRYNSPVGKKTLLCGHSNKVNANSKAKNIAQYFYDGKEEYQNDDKWYEMVVKAEINVDDDEVDLITDEHGDNDTGTGDDTNDNNDGDNANDPFEGAELIAEQKYDIESFIDEKPIKVQIYEYKPDDDELTKPISFVPDGLTKRKVYINRNHDLFIDFADDWKDLVLLEVASIYQKNKVINNADWHLSEIYYELKKKYDSDSMLNVKLLCTQAESIVDRIQEYLVKNKEVLNDEVTYLLSEDELKSLKNNYIRRKKKPIKNIDELVKDSSFLGYMDRSYIYKYIKLHPEHIFDDKVFTLPYADLDEDIREELLDEYMDSINDIFWFLNKLPQVPAGAIIEYKGAIIRHRYGLNYLTEQISF